MDVEIKNVLQCFRNDIEKLIEDDLLDIVLYGSTVRGGFIPGKGDIDFLVIVSGTITDNEIDKLKEYHLSLRKQDNLLSQLEGTYIGINYNKVINGYYVGTNMNGWKKITSLSFSNLESAMILDKYHSLNKTDILLQFLTYDWEIIRDEIVVQVNDFMNHPLLVENMDYTIYALKAATRSLYTILENGFISKKGALEWIKEKKEFYSFQNLIELLENYCFPLSEVEIRSLSNSDFTQARLYLLLINDIIISTLQHRKDNYGESVKTTQV